MINVLKWVATIVTIAGAIATALMIDPLNIWLLNLGAFLFLIWGVLIKEKAMIAGRYCDRCLLRRSLDETLDRTLSIRCCDVSWRVPHL